MKDTNVKVPELKGLWERQPQPTDALSELQNWKVDRATGAWTNKLGFERYNSNGNEWQPFGILPVDSIFYFQRHQGAQDSVLFEQGGTLYHLNDFCGGVRLAELDTQRSIPLTSEMNTQYAQFGQFVLYVNGYDKPAKSHLYPVVHSVTNPSDYLIPYPLGFQYAPSAPVAWEVTTNPAATGASGDKASIWFTSNNVKDKGLGIPASDKENQYKWKVTFVNNAGAESPISPSSSTITWTTPSTKYRFAVPVEIPTGDVGTVARRLYRTKNFSTDSTFDADTYYFVAEIPNNTEELFVDDLPDSALGALAPTDQDSIVFPSLHCRFMGIYKDCLFIDGGRDDDTTVYFSNPNKPDQFAALDFLSLGNRTGGGLTGLFGYFNFCLAFRENSIDIIRGDYPNFVATPLVQYIGTRATNTICAVPEVGIMFLGRDGVYALSGNPEYGATPNVQNLTPHLSDLFKTINIDAIHKATACYSAKRREYQVFFPVDGETRNSIGLVYHTDKGVWSMREGFPVGCLAVNTDGDVYFGYGDPATFDTQRGIMVMSDIRAAGQEKIGDKDFFDKPPVVSRMASAWLDMGDPSMKKKIHHIYLFVMTEGDQEIPMEYRIDFNYNEPQLTAGLKQQRTDQKEQSVYNSVKLDAGLYWEEPLVTTIRYDVHSKACSQFQWAIETQANVTVIGYAVDFTVNGTRSIKGRKL